MLSRRLLRIKVIKSVYAHLQCRYEDIAISEKNLIASIDKAYDLYFKLLALAPEIVRYAEERQEIGLNKRLPTQEDLHPNRKFVENRAIALIAASGTINSFVKRRSLNWLNCREVVKTLYASLCRQEFYKKYMASPQRSFGEDVRLLAEFYASLLEDGEAGEALDNALEEESILWSDDLGYTLTMVVRTVKGMKASHADVETLPKFKSEDDLAFAKTLLRKSIADFDHNKSLIDRYTSNWDVERVALMDSIILDVAITEAETFPSIPVKVTLNEYIDIAKYYSTSSSGNFINGVLDKVTETLAGEGKIRKTGKGLL